MSASRPRDLAHAGPGGYCCLVSKHERYIREEDSLNLSSLAAVIRPVGITAEPTTSGRLLRPATPPSEGRGRGLRRSQVIILVTVVLAFVLFDVLVIKTHQSPVVVSGPASIAKVTGVKCLGGRAPIAYANGTVEATRELPQGLIVDATELTTGGKQVGGGLVTFEHMKPGQPEPFSVTFPVPNWNTYQGCFITWHSAVAS
jgi:hypothetical protein